MPRKANIMPNNTLTLSHIESHLRETAKDFGGDVVDCMALDNDYCNQASARRRYAGESPPQYMEIDE